MEEMQGSQCRYRYCDGLAYLRTGSIVHISAALFRHALDPPETSQLSTHPGSQWPATRALVSLDEFGIETETCSKSSNQPRPYRLFSHRRRPRPARTRHRRNQLYGHLPRSSLAPLQPLARHGVLPHRRPGHHPTLRAPTGRSRLHPRGIGRSSGEADPSYCPPLVVIPAGNLRFPGSTLTTPTFQAPNELRHGSATAHQPHPNPHAAPTIPSTSNASSQPSKTSTVKPNPS